ncbi:MAG: DUF3373 family protein [Deltaproteobacteria bacterium]|nr:DUF3373 family protein [Deltaproteobacteria bacterium]
MQRGIFMHQQVIVGVMGVVALGFAASPARAEVANPPAAGDSTESRLVETEERLDQVEKKTVLDRINLGGEYRTILNGYVYDGPTADPYDPSPDNPAVGRRIEEKVGEVWSHRLRVSMNAEPVTAVRVTARLTLYKHFGDGDAPPFIQDSASTRVPRDSTARFDQAWIDWFITEWLAFSAGRIAYVEGNPAELKESSAVRRATWGVHMVDGEYETANLTFTLDKLLPGTYARLFYASWFNDNDQDVFGGLPFLTSGTDNLRIFGGNLDFKIPGLGKNFLQVGYYRVPRFRPFFVPIPDPGYSPESDYTRAPAPLNGSLLFPSKMPDSMGGYENLSGLFEVYDAGGIGLDLFVAGAYGILHPNGKGIEYMVPADPSNPAAGRQAFPFLFLASTGDDGKTTLLYAGFRFTFPIEALNNPRLGFEYNHGSRYLISFNTPSDQLLNKLATRGSAYETYLILPMSDHLFVRAGHLFIDADYSGGFFGPNPAVFGSTAPRARQRVQNINVTLNATL